MRIKSGPVLFAATYCPEHIEAGKKYLLDNKLTNDDIELKGSYDPQPFGEILIISKKDIDLIT